MNIPVEATVTMQLCDFRELVEERNQLKATVERLQSAFDDSDERASVHWFGKYTEMRRRMEAAEGTQARLRHENEGRQAVINKLQALLNRGSIATPLTKESTVSLADIKINAAQLDQILESRNLPGLTVRDLVVPGSIDGEPPYQGGQPPRQNVEFPDGGGSAPPPTGETPDNEVPPAGFYDAPPSSYDAANYEIIGGAGMNGYYLTTPHPSYMPATAENRPATKAAAELRYTQIGAELEASQAAAGFTGRYPEDQAECVAREKGTRDSQGEPDHKLCTEWFLLRHVFGLGGG